MMNSDQFHKWDQMIREGCGAQVAQELSAVRLSDVLQKYYADFINCARRVGSYGPAFALIKNEFFKLKESGDANERLFVEYAAMLSEVGALSIANEVFKRYPTPQFHPTFFYRALHAMKSWNYPKAIEYLNSYLEKESDNYKRNIAQLNLMSCYLVTNQMEEAGFVVEQIEKNDKELPPMAIGVLHEQKAERFFKTAQYQRAQTEANQAIQILQKANGPALLYSRKWALLIKTQIKGRSSTQSQWDHFYKECQALGAWEVLRDLDRHQALFDSNLSLLQHVYYGCPHSHFRQMILRSSPWSPAPIYASRPQSPWRFDRANLKLENNEQEVEAPELLKQLLFVLTSDNYRSFAVGHLFDSIYQGEYYHPDFAAQRIHQLVRRFRKFATELKLPTTLLSSKLGFSLAPTSHLNILYRNQPERLLRKSDHHHLIEEIAEEFQNRPIYSQDVADLYNISKRTAARVLGLGVEEGVFEKVGRSRSTHYRKVS